MDLGEALCLLLGLVRDHRVSEIFNQITDLLCIDDRVIMLDPDAAGVEEHFTGGHTIGLLQHGFNLCNTARAANGFEFISSVCHNVFSFVCLDLLTLL